MDTNLIGSVSFQERLGIRAEPNDLDPRDCNPPCVVVRLEEPWRRVEGKWKDQQVIGERSIDPLLSRATRQHERE
jgi:hypothetical protein